jgi:Leucine-rich repeat (LRR) protein
LLCFAILLSSNPAVTVEGTYSNTVLYPVTEEARAARGGQQQQRQQTRDATDTDTDTDNNNDGNSYSYRSENIKNNNNPTSTKTKLKSMIRRQPGAPSRYLEYEGPDATYSIRIGTHPTISYPNLDDFPDTQIRIRYEHEGKHGGVTNNMSNSHSNHRGRTSKYNSKNSIFQVDDCPRHFLWLSDRAVRKELDFRIQHGKWSERVLVEKAYFTLFYGGTGLASQYMDSVDDFQTDLKGWEIMNRSSNHCEWEGVECSNKNKNAINDNNCSDDDDDDDNNDNDGEVATNVVVGFQINGFSLEGTLPHDLSHLTALQRLDLHGNRIKGSIPASWGNLVELTDLNLGDNRLTGKLPSSLKKWTNLNRVVLSSNQLSGDISETLVGAWTEQRKPPSRRSSTCNKSKKRRERFGESYEPESIESSSSSSENGSASDGETTISPHSYFSGGLQTLDLSKNRFGGPFPWKALARYASHLKFLNISENVFTGVLPEEMVVHCQPSADQRVTAPPTTTLLPPIDDETTDQLESSSTPTTVKQQQQQQSCIELLSAANNTTMNENGVGMGKLQDLNLSGNQFKGNLPREWMRNMPYLQNLDLSENQITGSLPKELLKAYSLNRLKLVRVCICIIYECMMESEFL